MRVLVGVVLGLASLGWSAVDAAEMVWQPSGGNPVSVQTRVQGEIEVWPVGGGLQLRGWVVDEFSATRADLVQVSAGGRELGEVKVGEFERRPDVALRFGSSAFSLSGFQLFIANQYSMLLVRAHLGQLGWWQTSVSTSLGRHAQLNRLECVTAQLVEVEVSSDDPFPVRNALVELAIGPVVSSLSRYPDNGDLHTLIFQLTPDQLATVSPSELAMVRFNPGADFDTWTIGPIDPSAAVGCDALV